MDLKRIAKSLPYPLQKSMKYVYSLVPVRLRYGKVFWETYNFLQKSQWWSKEKLEEYQMEQLSKLLNHAYKNVPYYRRMFDERELKPKDIQCLEDLRKLPYLTKEIVRNNLDDLIAQNISEKEMEYVATGGTTGIPLGFYIEKKTNLMRMAFEWREWNWMGYKFGDRCVVLRGNVVKRQENGRPAWWEYDKENNYLILSTYDMTDENLPKYAQKIEEFKPKIIRGYPSALDILACFIKENNFKINRLGNIKAISTSSENLYPVQRELIEEVFRCPIFDKYGNCEQVTILGECEKHEGYHDFMEYSYTEILDKEGNPVIKEGQIGEIVSTGFTDYVVPFIRYKTEDLVSYTAHKCSCGRLHPLVKKIEGRWWQEMIVARDSNLISMTALNMHSDIFDNVKQFQFYQDTPGRVTLKIIKKDTYTEKDTKYIIQELQKKIKNQVKIEIEFVGNIPLTGRGKYRFLIQKLPTKFGDKVGEYISDID